MYLGQTIMRIAMVHDWLNQRGGAEDVLNALNDIFPSTPIYTSIYEPKQVGPEFQKMDIHVSWADKLPRIHVKHQLYLLVYPFVFNQFDFSDYDLVFSNKSGFCHGVRTSADTTHICYCLTPTRYVWDLESYLEQERFHPFMSLLLKPLVKLMQKWDRKAADGVDYFIAISTEVQKRISRIYERKSVIIFPPVDTNRFVLAEGQGSYFLVVSRLIPYKRIDLAVEACTKLGVPLKIAGEGRDRDRLEDLAGDNVEFLGRVSDEDLPTLMAGCKALLFPGLEDFGITPLQAMASGRPVIAFAGGGALDYVREGETGNLISHQTVDAFMEGIDRFGSYKFNYLSIRQFALKFDQSVFEHKIREFVATAMT